MIAFRCPSVRSGVRPSVCSGGVDTSATRRFIYLFWGSATLSLVTFESLKWKGRCLFVSISYWWNRLIGISQVSPPFAIAHNEPCRTRNGLFSTELTNNGDSYGIVFWMDRWIYWTYTSQETTCKFNSYDSVNKYRLYSGFLSRLQ